MTEPRRRHGAWLGVLLLLTMVAVAYTVPLPAIVSAIPFPDLPDVPARAKRAWRAVVIGAVVLAVIGEVEKERSRTRPGPDEEDEA